MLESIKKVDKKVLIMAGMMLGIILIIIVAIIIISLTSGGSISYEKIEDKLSSAAKNYYDDNEGGLPKKIGQSVEVSSETLVSGGYIKDLSKYTKKGVTCSGKAYVTKTYAGYDYVGSISCGDEYKTKFLYEKITDNVMSNDQNDDGLYKMEEVVRTGDALGTDENGYDLATNELLSGYIYRGDNVANYVKIDGVLYRIIKIDGNNDFVITTSVKQEPSDYDNRYNSESDGNDGINDYKISRIYDELKKIYQKIDNESLIKQKGVSKNICIGPRSNDDIGTDGSIECSQVMMDQYYSLIPVFDIMNASLSNKCDSTISKDCGNYNYLNTTSDYWTLTASSQNSYSAYKVGANIATAKAEREFAMKHVYYLTSKLVYVSGTGTKADPYIVK